MAPGADQPDDFHLRKLEKPEEFRAAEELAASTGTGLGPSPASATLQRAAQDHGGLVLGAFADIHLAGFSLAFLGWDGSTLYLYSHLTVVRPEYRNHHVARRLMLRARDELLQLGLSEIRWTIDPLESVPAFLSVRRLGALPDRYLVHHFGRTGPEGDPMVESDRVQLTWKIEDPRAEARIRDGAPGPEADLERWRRSAPIVETEVGETGLRRPKAVGEPAGSSAHLEIPFDLALLREHDPTSLRSWRHAVRDAFRAALDLGYRVDDYAVVTADHERRGFYFLRVGSPDGASPGPAGPR